MSILGWADRKRNQHVSRENQLLNTIMEIKTMEIPKDPICEKASISNT